MLRTIIATLVLLVATLIMVGCTTTESDIPWGAPAGWEGSLESATGPHDLCY